mgnify:CR=1 FL=1|jgi:hypothetical protein
MASSIQIQLVHYATVHPITAASIAITLVDWFPELDALPKLLENKISTASNWLSSPLNSSPLIT